MTRGVKPKSTGALRSRGTLERSRHDTRVDQYYEGTVPPCPRSLKGEARKHYNHVVRTIPEGVLKAVDYPALLSMSSWWGLYRQEDDLRAKALAFSCWMKLAKGFRLSVNGVATPKANSLDDILTFDIYHEPTDG